MKTRHYVLAGLAIVALSVLVASAYLLTSTAGLQMVYAWSKPLLPAGLTIERLEGRLIGPLTLTSLRYQDRRVTLSINKLRIDWRPWRLLQGTLRIEAVEAHGVDVGLTAGEKATTAAAPARPPVFRPPLAIDIGNARFSEIDVRRAAAADTVRIDSVELSGRIDPLAMEIRALHVSAATFGISIGGRVEPRRDYRTDLEVHWRIAPPGAAEFNGKGTLRGDLSRLVLQQELVNPSSASLEAVVDDPFQALRWRASLRWTNIRSHAFAAAWPPTRSSGQAQARGDLNTLTANGRLSADIGAYEGINADFDVERQDDNWLIHRLDISAAQEAGQMHVTGRVRASAVPEFDLRLGWQALAWPPRDAAVVSREGSVQVHGSLDDYRLTGAAAVAAAQLPGAALRFKAQGDRRHIDVHSVRADTLDGQIIGRANIDWRPRLAWRFTAAGHGLNPGVSRPDWPGQLDFEATGRGTHAKRRLELTAVHGTLRGNKVKGAAAITTAGSDWTLEHLRLAIGTTTLEAAGGIARDWDLHWVLAAPELADVLPDGAGRVATQGAIRGPRAQPQVRVNGSAAKLKWGAFSADSIELDADIDLRPSSELRLALTGRALNYQRWRVAGLSLHGSGTDGAHTLTLALSTPTATLTATSAGTLDAQGWRGQLQSAVLSGGAFGTWTLQAPVPLRAGSSGARLGHACWTADAADMCADGDWTPRVGGSLAVNTHAFPLGLVVPLLLPDARAAGTVDADGALAWNAAGDVIRAQAAVQLSAGSFSRSSPAGTPASLRFDPSTFTLHLDATALRAGLDARLAGGDQISAHIDLPRAAGTPDDKASFTADLRLAIQNIGPYLALAPGLAEARGVLEADITIAGSPDAPQVQGQAELRDAQARLTDLGVTLNAVHLRARGTGGALHVDGAAHSGNGRLTISGNWRPVADQGWPLMLAVHGQEFEIVKLPEAQAAVSPDLRIQVQSRTIDVTGNIHVPRAELAPRPQPAALPHSRDVVIVQGTAEQEATPARPWEINAHITLALGKAVYFNGFGLTGRLDGSVEILDEPGTLTTATGQVQVIDGKYKAYGQKLDVTTGQLLFTGGPVDDPGIDARAVRRSGDVLAGVKVRGTLKAPELSLFSEPAMSDTDALSYLLLGRPAEQANRADAQLLLAAATSLRLVGTENLSGQIAARFGLEELSLEVGSEGEESVALVLGTYLSPKLYVSYAIGLFDPSNVLRARYALTRRWTLEAESSSSQSGGDILYTIEP